MKTRIMYLECKAGGLTGPARIGRVSFSKTGATMYYAGKEFRSLKGSGFKANYFDVESGEHCSPPLPLVLRPHRYMRSPGRTTRPGSRDRDSRSCSFSVLVQRARSA